MSRTSKGLRDILFDEIDELRSGDADPQKSSVVIKAAAQILNIAKVELDIHKHLGVKDMPEFLTAKEEPVAIEQQITPAIEEPVDLEGDSEERDWGPEEDKYLMSYSGVKTYESIALFLERSQVDVVERARGLGCYRVS